jgi:hypothetical protein
MMPTAAVTKYESPLTAYPQHMILRTGLAYRQPTESASRTLIHIDSLIAYDRERTANVERSPALHGDMDLAVTVLLKGPNSTTLDNKSFLFKNSE